MGNKSKLYLEKEVNSMKMTNETYNKIKWIVMILLPALTSLVGGLGKAYGWDGTELAVTTLTLFTTFLGAITVKSSSNYHAENSVDKDDQENNIQ